MPQSVIIRMQLVTPDEVQAAKEMLSDPSSGLAVVPPDLSNQSQWNADPGIWLNVAALVISSIGAAESIFNLSRMFKKGEGEERAPADLTIIVNGTAYRIKEMEPAAIERLISE